MKKWSHTSARASMRFSPTRGREDGRGERKKRIYHYLQDRQRQSRVKRSLGTGQLGDRGTEAAPYLHLPWEALVQVNVGLDGKTSRKKRQIRLLSPVPEKGAEVWKSHDHCAIMGMVTTFSGTALNNLSIGHFMSKLMTSFYRLREAKGLAQHHTGRRQSGDARTHALDRVNLGGSWAQLFIVFIF